MFIHVSSLYLLMLALKTFNFNNVPVLVNVKNH